MSDQTGDLSVQNGRPHGNNNSQFRKKKRPTDIHIITRREIDLKMISFSPLRVTKQLTDWPVECFPRRPAVSPLTRRFSLMTRIECLFLCKEIIFRSGKELEVQTAAGHRITRRLSVAACKLIEVMGNICIDTDV